MTEFYGWLVFFVIILLVFPSMCIGPMGRQPRQSNQMHVAHAIGLAMYSFANDHDQKYPEGNSSTEVFQQLLDGRYVTDPTLFYTPLNGKTKAIPGQKLKPENVCWDVTCCVDVQDSPSLPLLFLTGYKVTYAPGGSAVPTIKPYPPYTAKETSWWDREPEPIQTPFITAFHVNNSCSFLALNNPGSLGAAIPNFVPADFDAKGKTYRQLTPDGPLR